MELTVLFWGEECINKNAFLKKTNSIGIDEVEIKRVVLFNKKLYGNKGSFKNYIGYVHKV